MPCKDFSPEEIVRICSDISRADSLYVKSLRKKSFFRRIGSESDVSVDKQSSYIARKLSITNNGIPSIEGAHTPNPESPRIEKKSKPRKFSVDSSLARMQTYRSAPELESIPGLHGRDVVAVAIICDVNGNPVRTYTEDQDIPEEEIKSAGKIFLSRVPVPAHEKQNRKISLPAFSTNGNNNNNNNNSGDQSIFRLDDVLQDVDANKRQKLVKKLDRTLMKLHTTDLNTALSFLKTARYAGVRQQIKAELLGFVTKELKMVPYP